MGIRQIWDLREGIQGGSEVADGLGVGRALERALASDPVPGHGLGRLACGRPVVSKQRSIDRFSPARLPFEVIGQPPMQPAPPLLEQRVVGRIPNQW
jgi:hypothetical protein